MNVSILKKKKKKKARNVKTIKHPGIPYPRQDEPTRSFSVVHDGLKLGG